MSALRPSRLVALARRDLEAELRGRRGVLFGLITGLLLLPAATLRIERPEQGWDRPVVAVSGAVPDAVAELPDTVVVEGKSAMVFVPHDDGTLIVRTRGVRPSVRRALDGDEPVVRVHTVESNLLQPGRSMLFALLSASVLTGAISESFGGERSRRTLPALLAAAITRGEIVVGKWLAWAGYGGGVALVAALVAILTGRVEAGWWLIPLPTVAAGTVAVAIYLVRHAQDVVGGAAISLRYMPALLAGTGTVSWFFGDTHPYLSAALPLGGALLAAGAAWPGPVPALIAAGSTSLFTALCLFMAARDLEEPPPPPRTLWRLARDTAVLAVIATATLWMATVSPILWTLGGNPGITEALPRGPGILAAGLAFLLFSVVRAGRSLEPSEEVGLFIPPTWTWAVGALAAVGLWLADTTIGVGSMPGSTALIDAGERVRASMQPTWVGPAGLVLLIGAQELMFRGWIQRAVGPVFGTIVFTVVFGLMDPVRALLVGGTLAALTHAAGGSVLPAIAARLGWALLAALGVSLSPGIGGGGSALVLAILAFLAIRRRP